jgi:hypothetical protein
MFLEEVSSTMTALKRDAIVARRSSIHVRGLEMVAMRRGLFDLHVECLDSIVEHIVLLVVGFLECVRSSPQLPISSKQVSGIASQLPVTQPVRKAYINQRRPPFNKVEKMLLMLGEH